MDWVDRQTRSRMMAAVKNKNTKIEVDLRRRLFAMGFRFRLHRKELPGKPDLAFPRFSAVIFVHGCFWHQHGCARSKLPEERHDWWKKKLEGNRRRDLINAGKLADLGWRVMVVWECSVRHKGVSRINALETVADQAAVFLRSDVLRLEVPAEICRVESQQQRGGHRGND
jgi:DNA mismatch endonuclease, patch repair protein